MNILCAVVGADPNRADNNGDTALHIAVQRGDIQSMTVLLADDVIIPNDPTAELIPVQINTYNNDGLTPFHVAVETNNLAAYRMLAERACIANIPIADCVELKGGDSALHIAVKHGALQIAQDLLANQRIDANKTNAAGQTPIYLARLSTGGPSGRIVELLLQHNAVDGCDSGGVSESDASESESGESDEGELVPSLETDPSIEVRVNCDQ